MSRSRSPLQSYYAARAGEYDAVYRKPERQADLREIEAWLPARLRGRRLLEVACGTGYWTQFLAPVAASIVAIDSEEEPLAIARQRVSSDNVSFEVGDAYELAPREAGFDAAFAGFWFSHVPRERQAQFLASLDSILEPGATVILLDNLFVEGSSTPIRERDERGNTYQSRVLVDGSTHRVLKNFPGETQLHALVGGGPGRAPRYRRWSYFWAFEYRT